MNSQLGEILPLGDSETWSKIAAEPQPHEFREWKRAQDGKHSEFRRYAVVFPRKGKTATLGRQMTPAKARVIRLMLRFRLSAPLGLTADQRDRDVPHRRIRLGAVPVAFAGLDVHDIADIDLFLLVLGCHHAGPRDHDQDLIAVMRVPARGAALAEVHHAAIVVL